MSKLNILQLWLVIGETGLQYFSYLFRCVAGHDHVRLDLIVLAKYHAVADIAFRCVMPCVHLRG